MFHFFQNIAAKTISIIASGILALGIVKTPPTPPVVVQHFTKSPVSANATQQTQNIFSLQGNSTSLLTTPTPAADIPQTKTTVKTSKTSSNQTKNSTSPAIAPPVPVQPNLDNKTDIQKGIDILQQEANQNGFILETKNGQSCTVDTISDSNPCIFVNPITQQHERNAIAQLTQMENDFASRASAAKIEESQESDKQLALLADMLSNCDTASKNLMILGIVSIQEMLQNYDNATINQSETIVNQGYNQTQSVCAEAESYLNQQNSRIENEREQAAIISDSAERTLQISEVDLLTNSLNELSSQVSNLNNSISGLNSTINSLNTP